MNHVPVLEEAAVDALQVRENGIYLDATFGRGGHARRILERLGPHGLLIALDADPDAIAAGRREFADEPRLRLVQCNFRALGAVAREQGHGSGVDGILMDLGVSSPQLDSAERGFSFRHDGPLDMRLDPESGVSAAEVAGRGGRDELVEVLSTLGEERFARRIARAILNAREHTPIRTTSALAAIVEQAVPARAAHASRIHPATRTFQAIRIAINEELERAGGGASGGHGRAGAGRSTGRNQFSFARGPTRQTGAARGIAAAAGQPPHAGRARFPAAFEDRGQAGSAHRIRGGGQSAGTICAHAGSRALDRGRAGRCSMKAWLVLLTLLTAVVASAIALIALKHQGRDLFIELEREGRLQDQHRVEWSRLQIELAWLGETGRIETLAQDRLEMQTPDRVRVLVADDG